MCIHKILISVSVTLDCCKFPIYMIRAPVVFSIFDSAVFECNRFLRNAVSE